MNINMEKTPCQNRRQKKALEFAELAHIYSKRKTYLAKDRKVCLIPLVTTYKTHLTH